MQPTVLLAKAVCLLLVATHPAQIYSLVIYNEMIRYRAHDLKDV